MTFGFREPYQVLVDAEMCTAATSLKLDIVKQFSTILQGEVKPMITQCCIVELYKLGRGEQPAVDLAKNFERRKCNHREAISGNECIASVVGDSNKHRYVIASQSQSMRSSLRSVLGVPIVHLNRTVMVLEPPSDATLKAKKMREEKALLPPTLDAKQVSTQPAEEQKKKKKGPKAPNPLSVKKKKVRVEEPEESQAGQKRKRVDDDSHAEGGTGEAVTNKPKRKRRKKQPPISEPNDNSQTT